MSRRFYLNIMNKSEYFTMFQRGEKVISSCTTAPLRFLFSVLFLLQNPIYPCKILIYDAYPISWFEQLRNFHLEMSTARKSFIARELSSGSLRRNGNDHNYSSCCFPVKKHPCCMPHFAFLHRKQLSVTRLCVNVLKLKTYSPLSRVFSNYEFFDIHRKKIYPVLVGIFVYRWIYRRSDSAHQGEHADGNYNIILWYGLRSFPCQDG